MALNEATLEKRFCQVSNSAGSIQSLSQLCLHYKSQHKKIASIWLRSVQKADVKHRLTLIYLANDIVQHAKRKNSLSFIEDFKSILKDTIPYLKDEKIKKPVERVFSIWQDRSIFDAKFTNELKNRLNNNGKSHNDSSRPSSGPDNINSNSSIPNRRSGNDLMECLNRLANIDRTINRIKSSYDTAIDRLSQGSLTSTELEDIKLMTELKLYISALKSKIDESNKLTRLLDESTAAERKSLKDCESQLMVYKNQLSQVVKLRDELG